MEFQQTYEKQECYVCGDSRRPKARAKGFRISEYLLGGSKGICNGDTLCLREPVKVDTLLAGN